MIVHMQHRVVGICSWKKRGRGGYKKMEGAVGGVMPGHIACA